MTYLIDMTKPLNINKLAPPYRDDGLLGGYAMRYRAAHIVKYLDQP